MKPRFASLAISVLTAAMPRLLSLPLTYGTIQYVQKLLQPYIMGIQAEKLLLRTAAGAGVLALLAQTSGALGIQLGVNLYNALVLGVLGAPGFGLLLMLNWLVRSG